MNYQQGTQRIEIIVRKENGGANEQGAREENANTSPSEQGENNTNSTGGGLGGILCSKSLSSRRVITNVTHAVAVSKQILNLAINYSTTGVGYATGDQSYQDYVQRQVEVAQDATSLASSTLMGALYGSRGGPVGAVLGAVMNTASTGASLIAKYATREREYNVKVFKENNAIEYNRARAGINLTNGRLR